eukprot:CAMPEP_0197047178 /NCGR_PEP_ID=MMETSP1384-20130603/22720_1 /TAXON_ID=29189 /ORGANISM="Ammonia sp." /LENGTH=44 /DNA_ID= /DNA_START= /DNA_END= /DNA_ORIENTATION=
MSIGGSLKSICASFSTLDVRNTVLSLVLVVSVTNTSSSSASVGG